ncbi:MAG: hypothetical protein K5657_02585 [Desulfovibrio sp.]|nr:hypothetical protein [Desulfovibrio sp.]
MLSQTVRKFGIRGRGWSAPDNFVIKCMKAVHLLFGTCWAGGALSMQALSFLEFSTADTLIRQHTAFASHFIDTWVVLPGLMGCMATGLFYSIFTSIGFFHFFWIGFKWIVSLTAAFWGLFFWTGIGDQYIASLSPGFLSDLLRFIRAFILPENMWQGALQLSVILIMCLISVIRPVHWPWPFISRDHSEHA